MHGTKVKESESNCKALWSGWTRSPGGPGGQSRVGPGARPSGGRENVSELVLRLTYLPLAPRKGVVNTSVVGGTPRILNRGSRRAGNASTQVSSRLD